jgi:hypothetical protein
MKKRKQSKKKSKDNVSYCIEILSHTSSYHLGLPPLEMTFPGPNWEHADIEITGKLLEPEALKESCVWVSSKLLESKDARRQRSPPSWVELARIGYVFVEKDKVRTK